MIILVAAIVACAVAFATASAVCKARQGADVARIALLEQRVEELSLRLGGAPQSTPAPAARFDAPPPAPNLGPSRPVASAADVPLSTSSLDAQVRALLARNKKIEAIKIYRDQTGVGLKEAKDAVEEIERQRLTQ